MRRIGLMVHARRSDAVAYAAKAAAYLRASGVDVQAEDDAARLLTNVTAFSEATDAPDAILSLGGDGTLLRGAQAALAHDVPLLGVNLGRVGFLAEAEPEDLEACLQSLLRGQYTLEERGVMEVISGNDRWFALNDVVITRGGYARLITLEALVDGETAGHYVADGVIVATPTGSTGYSLSAGGPIVAPSVDCMIITPVCAHSLQHRPFVVPGAAEISLSLGSDEEQHASLQVDGQSCAELRAGAGVSIRRAQRRVKLIRTRQAQFFQLVRSKLTEWSR